MTTPTNLIHYAIFAEQTLEGETVEMRPGMPHRFFNVIEAGADCPFIKRDAENFERIHLEPGTYRINGVSFLTMIPPGSVEEPAPPIDVNGLTNIYPGYCVLYDVNKLPLPTLTDMSSCICLGTMATAYDTSPSTFDCVHVVTDKCTISLGHQCGYKKDTLDHKVYLRLGGSNYHVAARIAIFKIA